MTDNVDTDIEIKIDSSQVKLDVPGKYLITLSARDKAKNIGKVEVPVYVNDYETHKEYLAAITLEKSKLDKSSSGSYQYEGITVPDSEVNNIEAGTMYRSISRQLEGLGEGSCRWAFFDKNVDEYKEGIISTSRGVRIGMDYNSVIYEYGKGMEGDVNFSDSDTIIHMLNDTYVNSQDDSIKYYKNQAKKYTAYKTQDGLYEMIFIFDENNKVSWILYDNLPNYS